MNGRERRRRFEGMWQEEEEEREPSISINPCWDEQILPRARKKHPFRHTHTHTYTPLLLLIYSALNASRNLYYTHTNTNEHIYYFIDSTRRHVHMIIQRNPLVFLSYPSARARVYSTEISPFQYRHLIACSIIHADRFDYAPTTTRTVIRADDGGFRIT